MFLIQRDEDFSVEGTDIRSETEGEVDGVLRKTDVVENQIELVRRNDLANLLLDLTEEHGGFFDARPGHGADMEAEIQIDSVDVGYIKVGDKVQLKLGQV